MVPEPAPGGAPRQADGGAGRLCRAWRRGQSVRRDGVAGELERGAGLPACLGPGRRSSPERGAEPRQAVEEALELLHEDYAYEFQIGWSLWELETAGIAGESNRRSFDSLRQAVAKDDDPRLRMTNILGAGCGSRGWCA